MQLHAIVFLPDPFFKELLYLDIEMGKFQPRLCSASLFFSIDPLSNAYKINFGGNSLQIMSYWEIIPFHVIA